MLERRRAIVNGTGPERVADRGHTLFESLFRAGEGSRVLDAVAAI